MGGRSSDHKQIDSTQQSNICKISLKLHLVIVFTLRQNSEQTLLAVAIYVLAPMALIVDTFAGGRATLITAFRFKRTDHSFKLERANVKLI